MARRGAEFWGTLALLVTAAIWGLAFVAQSEGMAHLRPCGFNAARSLLGGLALVPVIAALDLVAGRRPSWFGAARSRRERLWLLGGGMSCGLLLAAASLAQQYGIAFSTVGTSGFLTALYIVIVPLLGILTGRRTRWFVLMSALIALGGMHLLCFDGSALQWGDAALVGCAVLFSFHILAIDHFAPGNDCVRMACIQFFVAGMVSFSAAVLAREPLAWGAVRACWKPILFCGLMSSGVAYTLQMVGQKYVHPTVASLLMSLESVFAALGGWLIQGERMSGRQLWGCAAIFEAVVLAQSPIAASDPTRQPRGE